MLSLLQQWVWRRIYTLNRGTTESPQCVEGQATAVGAVETSRPAAVAGLSSAFVAQRPASRAGPSSDLLWQLTRKWLDFSRLRASPSLYHGGVRCHRLCAFLLHVAVEAPQSHELLRAQEPQFLQSVTLETQCRSHAATGVCLERAHNLTHTTERENGETTCVWPVLTSWNTSFVCGASKRAGVESCA